ncbi:alpha amylase N-terminal ig-like domain-containing protein [Poriferisphaera sp. WC338]|uniref:alpha amylase N-terminal ig-like domain-containing protein n=1 Tax=Poriferisphaera sp. WC338 TaxID=3425129 RepID=UPI003D818519
MRRIANGTGWGWGCMWALLFSLSLSACAKELKHTFRYESAEDVQSVSVVGGFNEWNAKATPMARGADGVWAVEVPLEEGLHHYKFVLNGEKHIADPESDPALGEGDGYGGENSGVDISVEPNKVKLSVEELAEEESILREMKGSDERVGGGKYLHRFVYRPGRFVQGKINSVSVAGSFNGWNKDTNLMKHIGNGVYEVRIPLGKGVHFYKFVVNGNRWMNDPASEKQLEQPDGHNGVNSAALVGPDGRELPKPKDNHIRMDVVELESFNVFEKGRAIIQLRTQAKDVDSVTLWFAEGEQNQWQSVVMNPVDRALGFDVYGVIARSNQKQIRYYFAVQDGDVVCFVGRDGSHEDAEMAKQYSYAGEMAPAFETPAWAKHVVWYQIFPERFRNGETANDPKGTKRWTSNWWETLPGEKPGAENFYSGVGNVWWRRYGGDMQGVKEALPYLRELGVTAIYFNPIFEGESMHKYDASDYRHVDDNFGVKGDLEKLSGETMDPTTWQWSESDKVFLDFIEEAHRQGFKIVIDGVFNHVGRAHYAFQDVLKNGKASKYADWFEITDWGNGGEPGKVGGIQWVAWDGPSGALPAFKKDPVKGLADGPRQHIFDITNRWMAPNGDPSKGIDGWRLDVPGDIPHPFWIEWRKLVKSINPDAYISGEIWHWAQDWLQGDQFDAVMNYRFAQAAQDFFVDVKDQIPPTELAARLNRVAYNYPFQVSLVQQNLFDSHDTDRFASMFVNPDLPYDGANRLQDSGPRYEKRRPSKIEYRRMLQAFGFQMTYVGAPMIYYGNEAGMWSPDDPSNRQPMTWPGMKFDQPYVGFKQDIFDETQKWIALRAALLPLRTGFYRPIITNDTKNIFGFARDVDDQHVYVVINRSRKSRKVSVPISRDDWNKPLVNLMGKDQSYVVYENDDATARPTLELSDSATNYQAQNGNMEITIPAYGTAVLVNREMME